MAEAAATAEPVAVAAAVAARLYGLAGTDVCRKACHWLERFGHAYRLIDVQRERPSPAQLVGWAQAVGGWDALVDRGGRAWGGLLPQRGQPGSEPEWTLLIREHPGILRLPVIELADGRVAAGFSGGRYEKLLGKHPP